MGTVTRRSFHLHRAERRATDTAIVLAVAIVKAAFLTGHRARDAARAAHRLTHPTTGRTAP